jgi:hypothetical protein
MPGARPSTTLAVGTAVARQAMRHRGVALFAVSMLMGCRRPPVAPNAFDLPDAIPGFVAGAREPGDGYLRRTYTAGGTRITVTLARQAMDRAAYEGWVSMSRPASRRPTSDCRRTTPTASTSATPPRPRIATS